MALIERLVGGGGQKIPVHQFMACVQEMARGEMTRADIIAVYSMDAADIADLDTLIARFQTETVNLDKFAFAHAVHDIFLLAESGTRYLTRADIVARIGRI